MTYVPNATQNTEPTSSQMVESAALEFRTLKTSVNSRINALQAASAALGVRTTALEQLAFNGSVPGTVVVTKFVTTAGQTVFTLPVTPLTVATVDVYVNGIYQNHDSFTLADNVVTLDEGVIAGAEVEIQASIALQLGVTSADLVEYLPGGAGAVPTTVQDKLRESVSVKDFGAAGDGTTDDTAAIIAANTDAAGRGARLWWPAGTYIASHIPVIAGMHWVGEDSHTTTIKAKAGSNQSLIDCVQGSITVAANSLVAGTVYIVTSVGTSNFVTGGAHTNSAGVTFTATGAVAGTGTCVEAIGYDWVSIESLRFDGNKANNTSGTTINLRGARPLLRDVTVVDSAGTAIVTNWLRPDPDKSGQEGTFDRILIDEPYGNGWEHYGPSDSHFNDVIIIDAGVGVDNAYYGFICPPLGTGGNGRFNNLHHWNRSDAANIPIAGVYLGFGGNCFTNCHFEGGYTSLVVTSTLNTFASCDFYAPRGAYAVTLTGTSNCFQGACGATFYSGNQYYTGVNLNGTGNLLDLTVAGNITPIAFNDLSLGGNIVRIVGNLGAQVPLTGAYTGSYSATDIISIYVTGSGGGSLQVAGSTSGFSAYASAATNLVSSTWTAVKFQTLTFDLNQEYSTSTSRWTCKNAGRYAFTGRVFFSSNLAEIKAVAIFKNGFQLQTLHYQAQCNQAVLGGTSAPTYMSVGDYIEVRAFAENSQPTIASQFDTYFSGSWAGA